MAVSFFGRFTCTVQDLANVMGVSVATLAGTIATSQTSQPLSNALYTGAASPFFGMSLLYTSGATIAAGDTLTIDLASGSRSGYNARRLAYIVDRIQNFASSGFLASTAPGGRIDETL